ncbi:MAG: monooxygenase [Polyangiales bacterium]
MRAWLASSIVPLLIVAGCGGTTDNAATNDAGTSTDDATSHVDGSIPGAPLPCEIDDVLARNCRTCHGETPKYGAPMSLVTWEDLNAPSPSDASKKVFEAANLRVHLPDTDNARMPQKPNPALSAKDLATFDAWISGGAPKKTADCTTPIPDAASFETPVSKPLSCTPDVSLTPKTPWAMPKDTRDIYICYGVEYSPATKRHITGVHPHIQNDKIVHHILLMTSDTAVDPTPHECGGAISKYRMLYGWAPGVGDFELPDVAGFPAEPGKSHFVVQVHYNNVKALDGETDTSGFDFCTTDKLRPNDADVMALGSLKFTMPAKSPYDITASFTVPSFIGTIHAIGAFPHMHKLGKSIATNLFASGAGSPIHLGEDPAFDFNNQFFEPLPDTVIKPGDRIDTRCIWQNDTANPVSWGENTDDEMCYSFTMYYPKIAGVGGAWSWQAPAYLSTTTVNK